MTRAALLLALSVCACVASQGASIAYGQTMPEETALSAYAMQPTDNDPRHPPRTHRVGANESLVDIAAHYQIPLRALIEQNQLSPPFDLAPGQVIELPPPRLHRVAEGESFEDVARIHSIDPRSLALLNRMAPPYSVRAGDVLVLPALAGSWASIPPPPAGEVIVSEANDRRGDAGAPPSVALRAPAPPRRNREAISDNSITPAAERPVAGEQTPSRFAWPVRGEILARFGAQPGGRRLDGIEIAAAEGAPIGAAEEGDVVYVGADVPGYGALVLVRHADGYVTAYGYARRALVREGQHVRGGEILAEVGRGASGRPRLLFQVRRGAQAVDPAPLLGLAP